MTYNMPNWDSSLEDWKNYNDAIVQMMDDRINTLPDSVSEFWKKTSLDDGIVISSAFCINAKIIIRDGDSQSGYFDNELIYSNYLISDRDIEMILKFSMNSKKEFVDISRHEFVYNNDKIVHMIEFHQRDEKKNRLFISIVFSDLHWSRQRVDERLK